MTNKERQKQLNEEKWYASEAKNESQSGKMYWCSLCKYKYKGNCLKTHEERDAKCLCATAYNRLQRTKYGKRNF